MTHKDVYRSRGITPPTITSLKNIDQQKLYF